MSLVAYGFARKPRISYGSLDAELRKTEVEVTLSEPIEISLPGPHEIELTAERVVPQPPEDPLEPELKP